MIDDIKLERTRIRRYGQWSTMICYDCKVLNIINNEWLTRINDDKIIINKNQQLWRYWLTMYHKHDEGMTITDYLLAFTSWFVMCGGKLNTFWMCRYRKTTFWLCRDSNTRRNCRSCCSQSRAPDAPGHNDICRHVLHNALINVHWMSSCTSNKLSNDIIQGR